MAFLSLQRFVDYIKTNFPQSSVSYPTALKLLREGKIQAHRVGSSYRISYKEAIRFGMYGNYEEGKTYNIPSEPIITTVPKEIIIDKNDPTT